MSLVALCGALHRNITSVLMTFRTKCLHPWPSFAMLSLNLAMRRPAVRCVVHGYLALARWVDHAALLRGLLQTGPSHPRSLRSAATTVQLAFSALIHPLRVIWMMRCM